MKFKISGEIVSNEDKWIYDFFGVESVCPADFDAAVESAEPGDLALQIEINSPGGSVFAGFEMFGKIKAMQHDGWRVSAYVTALAASAATTIMSACDPVLLSPVTQIMIHEPSCTSRGNKEDHAETIDFLKSIEESILDGYCSKCGEKTSKVILRGLMNKSTWMPAEKAIKLGLADGYISDEEYIVSGVNMAAQILSASNAAFDRSGKYEALLKLYEESVRAGVLNPDPLHPLSMFEKPAASDNVLNQTEPEPEAETSEPEPDDWSDKARLELERERYRYELS